MEPKFINRREELNFLERKHKEKGFQLLVFYGRRRVGKTELLTHFAKSKRHLYFLANKRGTAANADRLAEKAASFFQDIKPAAKDFDDVFKYIIKRAGKEKLIVIVDEFSYLVEKDKEVPSVFQVIVDEILKGSEIRLIFCGSSISMMEEGVLSRKSPLYGRRTGQGKVNPFLIEDCFKFFPGLSLKEAMEFYSVGGDIPAYLAKLDPSKNLWENIEEKILTKGEFLHEEGKNLLHQELKEPETYFDILKAMAKVSKPSEIAGLAHLEAKDLPKYIKNLQKIDLIEKITLITKKKSKKSQYQIKDNFMNFWFKFVYPYQSELEEYRKEEILELIKGKFDQYLGRCFERFCLKLIKEKRIAPFKFERIGKQWGKIPKAERDRNQYEIDICALNEKTKEILFGECKWQSQVNVWTLLNKLKEKASYVDWYLGKRKEYYVIFAKSFKESKAFQREKNVYCFELKDLAKVFREKKRKNHRIELSSRKKKHL